jgi:hypothetical protein
MTDDNGRQRVVRNGYLPERVILTCIGPVEVKVPRSRDREGTETDKIEFNSNIIPPYLRKTKSLEELIPCLYLRKLQKIVEGIKFVNGIEVVEGIKFVNGIEVVEEHAA